MKIAFITYQDSCNYTMVNIIKSFIKKGHCVTVYGMYLEHNHLFMFDGMNIEVKNGNAVCCEDFEPYDVVFSLIHFPKKLENINKIVFSFDSHYFDEPYVGTDIIIERGLSNWRPQLKRGMRAKCPRIVIGDPKLDKKEYQGIEEKKNRLLFIDCGHYPFGEEGKKEVANLLLEVCRKYKDYEVIVKPRFLKNDKNVTHENDYHLYDVIEQISKNKLPDNLILRQEHTDLTKEIAEAHTVICMYTTAYIDAAVQGKGLIVLENLPNEENADLRINTHWENARKIIKTSGCLVDYREAVNYLPEGLKCDEKHLQQMIYSTENVNEKIVDCIEMLYNEYFQKGLFLENKEYVYENNKMFESIAFDIDKIKIRRKSNTMRYVERVFYKNADFFPTDDRISTYIENLEETDQLNGISMDEAETLVNDRLIEYADEIPVDAISQAYYFRALLYSNKIEKVFDFPKEKVLTRRFYNYVKGRAYYSVKNYKKAIECFDEYNKIEKKEYAMDLGDIQTYVISSKFYSGMAYFELERYDQAKKYFEECQKLTGNTHFTAEKKLSEIAEKEKC